MADPETFLFEDDGAIPNSRLPLLVYKAAISPDPFAIEQHFSANSWLPAWRYGVHPFHHFHANTHEVLGVARGHATVLFGGPTGHALSVSAGDVVVIPAGVGHCNIRQSPDLLIVGAYPDNAPRPDLHRGDPTQREALLRKIAGVLSPNADPVTGRDGPLGHLWDLSAA